MNGSVAILAASMTDALCARTVGVGESVIVSGADAPVDYWELSAGSKLLLKEHARANYINAYRSELVLSDAQVASSYGSGINATSRNAVRISKSSVTDTLGVGIALFGSPDGGVEDASSLYMSESSAVGMLAGVHLGHGGGVEARSSTIRGSSATSIGMIVGSGRVRVADGSVVDGGSTGLAVEAQHGVPRGTAEIVLSSGSTIRGVTGPAILVRGASGREDLASISVSGDSHLVGGNGVILDVRDGGRAHLAIETSRVNGDVVVSHGSSALLNLRDGGWLEGSVTGSAGVTLDRNGVWLSRGDSVIRSLTLNGGTVGFMKGGDRPRQLRVDGDLLGVAGGLVLNAHMDKDGPEGSWADNLFVLGDVDVLRPVDVLVSLTGDAWVTDLNGNGRGDSGEGLSLIRVSGKASPDAFRLAGGFVTLGPYQYELSAFSGDDVQASQATDGSGHAQWDYRLVSRHVCESACSPGDGGGPGTGDGRRAVAPQVASYISAPNAVFAYTDGLTASLHQRMGEIRDHAFEGRTGAELFARLTSRAQRYSSTVPFTGYGYDFDERTEAWQFGGSIVGLDGDNGSVRAGWSVDHGRTSVVPRAVDGSSVTRLKANGTSAWFTWRGGHGIWLDWVVGRQRLRGQTDTVVVGTSTGRVKAASTTMSIGAGWPFQAGVDWVIEPRVLSSLQSIRISPISDASGMTVRFDRRRFVTTAAGVSFLRSGEVFSPSWGVEFRSTAGGGKVAITAPSGSTAARFLSGKNGSEFVLSSGLTAQLSPRWQVFGDGFYRHYLGPGGFQGWGANLGTRVTF